MRAMSPARRNGQRFVDSCMSLYVSASLLERRFQVDLLPEFGVSSG